MRYSFFSYEYFMTITKSYFASKLFTLVLLVTTILRKYLPLESTQGVYYALTMSACKTKDYDAKGVYF
jgi:hypothetical protein